jgi:nicotinate phosphoribosyltransferase
MKLNHEAYMWLQEQINSSPSAIPLMAELENLRVSAEEIAWLRKNCTYLPEKYLDYLQNFQLYPKKQVILEWHDNDQDISVLMHGLWIDTILYEIPILALVSEAYFRFIDKDWDYVGQYGIATADLLT